MVTGSCDVVTSSSVVVACSGVMVVESCFVVTGSCAAVAGLAVVIFDVVVTGFVVNVVAAIVVELSPPSTPIISTLSKPIIFSENFREKEIAQVLRNKVSNANMANNFIFLLFFAK